MKSASRQRQHPPTTGQHTATGARGPDKLRWFALLASLVALVLSFGCWGLQKRPIPLPNAPPDTVGWSDKPVPSVSEPGLLQWITDPTFGTQLARVSDQRHHYSKDQPWNADQTLIKINNELHDAKTLQLVRMVYKAPRQGNWSNLNPNWWYGSTDRGKQFIRVDMTTDAVTVLHTWPQYNTVEMGFDEGNISNDDQWALLLARNGDGIHYIVYNIQNDTIVADKVMPEPDWAGMSASGKYVIIMWNDHGMGSTEGVGVYDRNLNYIRTLFDTGQHGDVGRDAAGNDVFVQYDNSGKVVSWNLDTGKSTMVFNQTAWGHISCRNNIGRPGWCYVTSDSEVFAVKLDASQTVERFAHHHSSGTSYEVQPQAVPNRDGSQVLWSSDWGQGGPPAHAFVAKMH